MDIITSSGMKFVRHFVYIVFAVYCIRANVAFIGHVNVTMQILAFAALFCIVLFSWFWTKAALTLFIAGIPVVTGLQAVGFFYGAPILDFIFSNLYLAWFVKRCRIAAGGNTSAPNADEINAHKDLFGDAGFVQTLILSLAFIVILSNLFILSYFPYDYILHRSFRLPFDGQSDPLFALEASFVILQGLIFFMILTSEKFLDLDKIRGIVFFHSITILIFALVQIIFQAPELHYKSFGVFSPFRDLHSFGSAVIVYFCIHAGFLFYQSRVFLNKLHLFFSIAFAVLIVLSGSNVAIAAMLFSTLAFLVMSKRTRTAIALFAIIVSVPLLLNVFQVRSSTFESFFAKRLSRPLIIDELEDKYFRRLILWQRGASIIEEFPLSGAGIGNFHRISPFFHSENDLKFQNYYQNAHNYLIQFGAELGIPAVLIFCLIIALPIIRAARLFLQNAEWPHGLFGGLYIGFCLYVLTMLTGHPLLLSEQQYLFWFFFSSLVVLIGRHESLQLSRQKLHRFVQTALLFILCIVVVFQIKNRVHAEIKNYGFEYGFAYQENLDNTKLRWTLKHAMQKVQLESNLFGLKIYAPCADCQNRPQTVSLDFGNKHLATVRFEAEGSKIQYFYLPSLQKGTYDLEIRVDQMQNRYECGIKSEKKYDFPVGVAVSDIEFLHIMPRHGIGLSDSEGWPADQLPPGVNNQTPVYRASQRATLNVQGELPLGGLLYLLCSKNDTRGYPVNIQLLGDNKFRRNIQLQGHKWHKVELTKEQVEGIQGLTIVLEENNNSEDQQSDSAQNEIGVAIIVEPHSSIISNPTISVNHRGSSSHHGCHCPC